MRSSAAGSCCASRIAAFQPARLSTRASCCRQRMPPSTVAVAVSLERPGFCSLRWTRSETVNGQNPSQAIEPSSTPFSDDLASSTVESARGLSASPFCAGAASGFVPDAFFGDLPFPRSADFDVRRPSRVVFSDAGSASLPNDQRRSPGAGSTLLRWCSHSASGDQPRLNRHDSVVSEQRIASKSAGLARGPSRREIGNSRS